MIDSSRCAQHIAATAAALLVGFRAALWSAALAASEPLEPAAALADFALPPGYRIELVAAEPEIVDPVAMAFDPRGRLWVVEMRDYPLLAAGTQPASRIRILEDKNRDGRFESASTFADGLLFPTGLQLWGSGAFVTLAGEIAYFPDDDHDGRADRHETWYRGFATHNEQLRANHPTLAADGWIYVAGGLRGGTIENLRRPADAPISINGRDFAFNPRTGEFWSVSGNGQFGLAIDDYGRRFTCSNRNPLIEVMIEQRYQDLNPALILPAVVQDAAAAGADSRIFARSRALTTSAQHAGQFTAACGVDIYRGDGLPTTAYGNAFICEPTANVVHREIMMPYGSVMRARSAEQDAEFLTAADEWFRPVNLADGPDGALYVVDMYRAVIEHPEWMTPELRDRPDLLKGIDRGRIYRILAEGASRTSADGVFPNEADPEKLAGSLSHPNSWRRETAARLLLELGGAAVTAPLQRAAASADATSARWLAFSTLDALSGLTPDVISTMLRDGAPEIRALGLRLAEPHLATSAALATQALALAVDPDPRVRYQAALTSMVLPSLQTISALREIAMNGVGDDWTCRAVALASRDQAGALLSELLAPNIRVEFTPALARELMAAVVVQDQGQQLPVVLSSFDRVDRQTARMLLLAAQEALQQRGMSLVSVLEALHTSAPTAHHAIQKLFDESLDRICDGSIAESARIAEARLLQLDARPAVAERLLVLLAADASTPTQAAAIAALRSQTAPELADALLAHIPSQLPTVRRATVELLSSRREWTAKLLQAIATEQIAASDVDPARRLQLMQSPDPVVRTEAERLFGSEFKDREEVVARYQPALQLSGNAERGHAVYLGNCASCHRIGDEGTAIGPDIGDASMKTSAQLLTDILDPNRAVDANFVNYVALTLDGVSHQGLIKSETANGLVLFGADGKSVAILREDLQSLASGNSLMPVGLERQIDPQQMADLLAFLKTWRHAAELRANRTDDHANAGSLP